MPLARGERVAVADELLYEYYWERNFPQTPTMLALRGRPLQVHPLSRHLGHRRALRPAGRSAGDEEPRICAPARELATEMSARLFELLTRSGGMAIPLAPDQFQLFNGRLPVPDVDKSAPFPPPLVLKPNR